MYIHIIQSDFGPQAIANNNISNAVPSNGIDGDGNGGGSGIFATICAAFCKDNPIGEQLGMNTTNNNVAVPITSQSK